LSFDDFQGIEPNVRLWYLQTAFQDSGVFELHHKKLAVRMRLEDLLEGAYVVYGCKEG